MAQGEQGAEFCWAELSPEEVWDLLRQLARRQGGQAISGFLDTHQWYQLHAEPQVTVDGGHPHAQFRRAGIGVAAVPTRYHRLETGQLPEGVRTSKQLRAWLYRTGLPDSSVGDIVVAGQTLLITSPEIELIEAGLEAQPAAAWDPPPVKLKRTTAASARADAVIAAAFRVSRGEAQTAIEYGFVFRNFAALAKRTQALEAGDQLVFRTKGRAELVTLETNPRSGRVWVEFRPYPA